MIGVTDELFSYGGKYFIIPVGWFNSYPIQIC